LKRPWGVAITWSGEVVITEWDGYCVSVFNTSGRKLRSFHIYGSQSFNRPCGVTVLSNGNILVVDYNLSIQIFREDGKFLRSVKMGYRGTATDIAYNPYNNRVYVADNLNHHIKVLNPDLSILRTFGSEGRGKGQFQFPSGIDCYGDGKVYVADTNNHRIQVFTGHGKFLNMFGKYG
jgi:tripartite motif-containing protein 2/3/tripartite motif-containing protein 71